MLNLTPNRVLAWFGPYIAAASGTAAAWLFAKLNVLGIPGLDENNLKTGIAAALTWLVVTGVTWAGHSKWLSGHHVEMAANAQVSAAAMTATAAAPAPALVTASAGSNGYHPDAALAEEDAASMPDEDLPSDAEEFAVPPSASELEG
jgi:hypothetical protein